MKRLLLLLIVAGAFLVHPHQAAAATMGQRLSGYFLIQPEAHGETWYVYPKNQERYDLAQPVDAFRMMNTLAIGITDANLAKIPVAGSSDIGDLALRTRLSGYFLFPVQGHGGLWYVYPRTRQRIFFRSAIDVYPTVRQLSLGISNANIAAIPIAAGFGKKTAGIPGTQYTIRAIPTSRGTFTVDTITIDRTISTLRVMLDTAENGDCSNNCGAFSLLTYVQRRGALIGMHGAYACPKDYAACAGKSETYFAPLFNSFLRVMINNVRIKYTTQPLVAFDTNNVPYYFHQAIGFKNQATFEATNGVKLQTVISNGPAMVENGVNVLDEWILDTKQHDVKSYRGALGWKGTVLYLMVVHGATVIDSAAVLNAMGLDYAINLDGGGSTALYDQGRYLLGPGRDLTNAILLVP